MTTKKVFALFFAVMAVAMLAAAVFIAPSLRAFADATSGTSTVATTIDGSATSSDALQAQIDAQNQQIASLNQQIAQYQTQLTQIGSDKKTLQAAISSLDIQKNKVEAQIGVTQNQMKITQLQIQQLGGQIQDAQQTIADDQSALGEYLVNLEKDDGQSLLVQVLSSQDLAEAWSDTNATLQIEGAVQNQMLALQAQEQELATSKAASQQKQQTLASQQQTLSSQQQSLTQTAQSKTQLLAETNQQESKYEQLLAAAQAELNSFTAFTQNAGGSKLIPGQTQCDAWGCYYNQRDALWGSLPLDGTKYTLASDGCLVTSLAMVLTHYGYKDVTPVTINSNPGNFAAYYPAYLLTTITVDGATVARKTATIDATLKTGNPVIVGLNAYGGTHYVVLVSGSKGNYIMRDPYVQDGDNIPFSSHYSLREIFGISKVVVTA